ncbi:hypothetical protein HFO33_35770 [Rhizobium leguminosarum]|uniref:hypothetical protein n=1 Tax=Rhizobium leguminosarum TaxID=384 RepID=UPI001C94E58E|nr:hypothetical protein [Rhizobium leguminosarum]MBY5721844.1 hypothetical protein [Rhizobium leguminosarum]
MLPLDSLNKRLASLSKFDVVVRTTGGPVDVWLTLGEAMQGKLRKLIVDEACFSSCANYLIPIAQEIDAGKNSLIVWHGGPTDNSTDILNETDVPTAIHYDDLARRTLTLYQAVGVDSKILQVSSEAPSTSKFRKIFGGTETALSGYAFSPVRLTQCFGFRNLKNMWHAGDDKAVAELAQKRSANLIVLESPSTVGDGSFECNK